MEPNSNPSYVTQNYSRNLAVPQFSSSVKWGNSASHSMGFCKGYVIQWKELRTGHQSVLNVSDGTSLQSSNEDSVLSLLRTWTQSLVRERRFHKPCGTAGKEKTVLEMMRRRTVEPQDCAFQKGRMLLGLVQPIPTL